MISVRLLPLEHIKEKLESVGCQRVESPDDIAVELKTAEWWKTPWDFYFTVPKEVPESPTGTYGFGAIMEEINKTKPSEN